MGQTTEFQYTKINVLLIDSHQEDVLAVKNTLSKIGVKGFFAKKISEAQLMMKNQKFEILMIRNVVEDVQTHNFILRLRRSVDSFNYDTPIIYLTDKLLREDLETLGKNISTALIMPFDEESLSSSINKVLKVPPAAK